MSLLVLTIAIGEPWVGISKITHPSLKAYAKKIGAEVVTPRSLKNAALGITGVKKILLQAYNLVCGENALTPFDTEEEAKEWLVKD